MAAVAPNERETLLDFFKYIWGEVDGYAYVAFKVPGNQHQFVQRFFPWPEGREEVLNEVFSRRTEFEVYFAPAIFSTPEAKKQNVKGARVYWCEFDGAIPSALSSIPEPTLRVQSSAEGHEHWYWLTEQLMEPHDLERVNRSIAYLLNADASGWDATQILRPPFTLNHKREREVKLLAPGGPAVAPDAFVGLPEPPPLVSVKEPESLPDVTDVIARYKWLPPAWKLFRVGVPEGQRSTGLMSLGYYCAEMGMTNDEMVAVLINADARWGKFDGRQDRMKRLLEIVTRARKKYPLVAGDKAEREEAPLVSMGLKTLMATEVNLSWVWEGFLQEQGYMLLTGMAGVGKTQFSLNAAATFALGRNFLDAQVPRTFRVGFFSLEMGLMDLKHFLATQVQGYSEDELEALEKQLRFYPLGEPLYLNRADTKQRVERAVAEEGLDGIIIDSLGSTTEGELGDEKDTKNLMDWNDRLRQEYSVFTWYVHHHRKAQSDNKKPNKLSDIYGSQYITARATTVLTLWDAGVANTLDVLPLKIRLAEKPERFTVYRDGQLRFTKKVSGITVVSSSETVDEETEKTTEQDSQVSQTSIKKGSTTESFSGIDF